MAKQKILKSHPRDYLQKPKTGDWPDSDIVANAPPEALLARHISIVLRATLKGLKLSHRAVEARTGVTRTTVKRLIEGDSWPVLWVIANIERELGVALWVPQHNVDYGDDTLELRPRCYLDAGTWPTGRLVDDAPTEVRLAREIASTLSYAMQKEDLTDTKISTATGVPQATIMSLLRGDCWPDLPTIHRLENSLNIKLWVQLRPQE